MFLKKIAEEKGFGTGAKEFASNAVNGTANLLGTSPENAAGWLAGIPTALGTYLLSGLWDRKGENRLSRFLTSIGIGAGVGFGAKGLLGAWRERGKQLSDAQKTVKTTNENLNAANKRVETVTGERDAANKALTDTKEQLDAANKTADELRQKAENDYQDYARNLGVSELLNEDALAAEREAGAKSLKAEQAAHAGTRGKLDAANKTVAQLKQQAIKSRQSTERLKKTHESEINALNDRYLQQQDEIGVRAGNQRQQALAAQKAALGKAHGEALAAEREKGAKALSEQAARYESGAELSAARKQQADTEAKLKAARERVERLKGSRARLMQEPAIRERITKSLDAERQRKQEQAAWDAATPKHEAQVKTITDRMNKLRKGMEAMSGLGMPAAKEHVAEYKKLKDDLEALQKARGKRPEDYTDEFLENSRIQ